MPLDTAAPATFMTATAADRMAAELNAEAVRDLDGWRYRAVHPPAGRGGFSTVAVFDADGTLIGKL